MNIELDRCCVSENADWAMRPKEVMINFVVRIERRSVALSKKLSKVTHVDLSERKARYLQTSVKMSVSKA